MKIILKNYRCFENDIFDLGNKGITLIEGVSGAGKTTIMSSIFFALYGSGTKLISYGKTSCSVKLEFDDLQVERTKRPNRLIVIFKNKKYEDEVAQGIINERFGTTFRSAGYIEQGNVRSFVLMSPADKLEFLEKFVFGDTDLSNIKRRCKEAVSKTNDDFVKATSKAETIRAIIENEDKPNKIGFPIKCSKGSEDRIGKNEETRAKNCKTRICKYKRNKISLEKELSECKELETSKKILQSHIEIEVERKNELKNELNNCNYLGDKYLEHLIEKQDYTLKTKTLKDFKNKFLEKEEEYIQVKEKEEKQIEKDIEKLSIKLEDFDENVTNEEIERISILYQDALTIKKLQDKLGDTKDIIPDPNLEQELADLKEILRKLRNRKKVYKCPSCSCNVFINGEDSLSCFDDQDINLEKYTIQELTDNISECKAEIEYNNEQIKNRNNLLSQMEKYNKRYPEFPDYKVEKQKIDDLRKYLEDKRLLSKSLTVLKNKKLSQTCINMGIELKKLKEKINLLEDKYKDIHTPECNEICKKDGKNCLAGKELESTIYKQELEKEKERSIKIQIKNTKEKKYKYKKQLIEHEKKMYRNKEDIEDDIINSDKYIECEEEKFLVCQKNIEKINVWKQNEEKLKKYNKKVKDLATIENNVKEEEKRHAAALTMKEMVLKAESIAIMNCIDTINSNAQIYLDYFFSTNPITVQLVPFKENKTKKSLQKPQINFQIEYKGMESDISSLSGGELARMILAFAIALCEIPNSPLLMLDEITASLNQELTSEVFNAIRTNYKGKLVLVVAHQLTHGEFDNIVHIE